MTRLSLTDRQRQLYEFVRAEIASGRGAPSYAEIGVHLGGASKSAVYGLVQAVVERGWLMTLPNRARCLALQPGPPGDAKGSNPNGVAPLLVKIPPALAMRLKLFCADSRQKPGAVVQAALDAHLRGAA